MYSGVKYQHCKDERNQVKIDFELEKLQIVYLLT